MPEFSQTTASPRRLVAMLAFAPLTFAGCLPGAGVHETGTIARPVAPPSAPNAIEAGYIGSLGRTIFRHRPSERGDRFVIADPIVGYGACVRSEAPGGGYDYALVLLQRRILEDAISQVADDAIILRGPDDTAICREPSTRFAWIATA